MSRNLAALRNHLFETLEALKAKENPMEIARAQAIAQVSSQIIGAAKVELQFLNTVGQGVLPPAVDPKETGTFFQMTDGKPNGTTPKGLNTGKTLGPA